MDKHLRVDFFLAGSTKSGTTSIYHALRRHPDVVTTKTKEPHYFSQGLFGSSYVGIGEDITSLPEYWNCFPEMPEGKMVGDFDVMTLHGPRAIELIREINPNPKILLILRNPIERAFSHYLMDVRECVESRPFVKAIQEDYAKYSVGSDEYCALVRLGFYAEKIRKFKTEFGADSVRVWLYDDLCQEPKKVLSEMAEFIGINPTGVPDLPEIRENEAGVPRTRLSSVILRARFGILRRPRKLYLKLPAGFRKYVRRHFLIRSIKPPGMPTEARKLLTGIYESEILNLGQEIGLNLINWLRDPTNPMAVPAGLQDVQKAQQAQYFDEATDDEFEIERPWNTGRLYEWSIGRKFDSALGQLSFPIRDLRLLDICCGSGMAAEFYAAEGAQVTGLDISGKSIDRAKERAKRHGFSAVFVIGDAEKLPYPDRSFDVVTVHDGLHHLPNPHQAIREMLRVAARAVIIIEPARSWLTRQAVSAGVALDYEDAGNYVYRFREEEIFELAKAASFRKLNYEQYLLYYRHEPFSAAKLFEKTPLFYAFPFTFGMVSYFAPRLGNKISVICER